MDAFESVATKLDIREFSPKQVPPRESEKASRGQH